MVDATMSAGEASSSSSSRRFAKIFSSYHDQYAEAGPSTSQLDSVIGYDVVLDQEGGLVSSLTGALEEQIRSDMDSMEEDASDDLRVALLREHRTWQLIRTVYENRIQRVDEEFEIPSAKSSLGKDPYISPEELTQKLIQEDAELSLFSAIIDHLQSRPLLNSAPPLEARHGYLPSTIRRAKTANLTSAQASNPSLDPDFTLRDPHGKGLAGEDQTYQLPLLETLWNLVRHGEIEKAMKVCEEGGQPWRAASLIGGRRWTMGGMTRGSIAGPFDGNRSRLLWKKSCRALANNPTLSTAERRLYAALISDLSTLLPACESWEDQLWAHIQARLESKVEKRLRELGGFWQKEDSLIGGEDADINVEGGFDEIFARLADSGQPEVKSASHDPYYVAQRMIIQGRADLLLEQFASRLPGIEEAMSPELISPLVRFFAHLVLLLRTLEQAVPDTAANAIVEKYLAILEYEGENDLVAMYAACLRKGSGEDSYARFLRAMDPNATREAKVEALNRARQHHLDTAVIAKETVRLILEVTFTNAPALVGDEPDPTYLKSGLDEKDVYLIRSIEWLTMSKDTAKEALIQSNAVARYFLALGQTHAAQSLLSTLPSGISNIDTEDEVLEGQLVEHEHFRQLFGVYACHELVDEVLTRTPKSTAPKMEQHQWRKALGNAIDKTERATIELLTGDWLRYDLDPETDGQRLAELHRIRQTFIPDLVMRLHNLLIAHHDKLPQLLTRALDLTKMVAAERNHIYEEFFGRSANPYRLTAYLDRVREAGLLALKSGSGSAFTVNLA